MTGHYMDNQNSQPINENTVTDSLDNIFHPETQDNDLGHDKLMAGLYFIWDAFSRSQMDFFLVRQTAKDVIAKNKLQGDHLDIGVRHNEWVSGNSDLLEMYFNQEHVDEKMRLPDKIDYEWQGIPFTIRLYMDSPSVTALVPHAYEYETWNIPNQFERFDKELDK